MLSALDALGPRAPVVAFPRSSEASYWHDRGEGAWARYVIDEVIPAVVRRFDADPRRVAIGGISMGGFGALDLARLHRDRFCAAGGHSAAIWQTGGETAPGAFDDADDFARHDVIAAARAGEFEGLRLWLDAGDEDPFLAGQTAFADAAGVSLRTSPGGHDGEYWDSMWPAYLRFYARALGVGELRRVRGWRVWPGVFYDTRASSDISPLSVWLVALVIWTGTSSPGAARPSKLTTLLWRVRPRTRLASVREVPSTSTSSVRPTNRCARSRARRWTTSTSRSIRSTATSCGTNASVISAASVPRRGE